MGGVRGDVIALNFIQTVIMEMGEPPAVQEDDPAPVVEQAINVAGGDARAKPNE